MVFYGKARWDDAHEEHGAHGDFKPHESPPIMLVPARRARRAVHRRRCHPPAVQRRDTKHLEHWLEPVIEFAEPTSTARSRRHAVLAGWRSPSSSRRRHRRSASLVYNRHKAQGDRADGPRRGLVLRPGRHRVHGRPRSRGLRRRSPGSTRTSSTARSTASARRCARWRRADPHGRRAATCATTPRRSVSASCCCSPGSSSCGGSCDRASRILTMLSLVAGGRVRWSSSLLSEPPARVGEAHRAAVQRAHRRR